MLEQARSWRIERSGNVVAAGVWDEFAYYSESSGTQSSAARHPAWELVLPWNGGVTATVGHGGRHTGHGLLLPPGEWRRVTQPPACTVIWIDPHRLGVSPAAGVLVLDRSEVSSLLRAASDEEFDADRLRHTTTRLFGGGPDIDRRLRTAVDLLVDGAEIAVLAARAGISDRRLRQLATQGLGGTLTQLRRWHRLRAAGLALPFGAASEVAAQTGFADQSHLIRTSMALCGRTPGSSAASWQHDADGSDAGSAWRSGQA